MTGAQQVRPASGYASAEYARAFAEFGSPRRLEACGGWVLERPIPGSELVDAMGLYPLFTCTDWDALADDVESLRQTAVSLTLVTEPFAPVGEDSLAGVFDRVQEFKHHFVTDASVPPADVVKASHMANVRKALRKVDVRVCTDPLELLDEWLGLWGELCRRHSITGMKAFSRESFAAQFAAPGIVGFEARSGDELVGLDLWYVDGDVAHGHLVAFSPEGYRLRASYATKWRMLEHFHGKVAWIGLGAGAGLTSDANDGLSAFKRGWSTGTRSTYLCASVLQPEAYAGLTGGRGAGDPGYFPAYREGEFA